jgi:hypothetical protein
MKEWRKGERTEGKKEGTEGGKEEKIFLHPFYLTNT